MKVPCAHLEQYGLFLELPNFPHFRSSLCCFNKAVNNFIDWENFMIIH